VIGPDGRKMLDFNDCHYHVWNHSQPFSGEFERDELVKHIAVHPKLADAVPLRVTYYREKWGLAASQQQVDALPQGRYRVHIDTEHFDGFLRMGEFYLPGESEDEVLITSYLCHPRGANDNLSGPVVGTELFMLLSQEKKRRFSYRFVIWPETIGSITYVAKYPERIQKTIGGYIMLCMGDPGEFHYKQSKARNSLFDRAAIHALRTLGYPHTIMRYQHTGGDERTFNAIGVRLPFGSIMRSPPGQFSEYHTSKDDLSFVRPEALLESLKVYWKTIMTLERARAYRGNFTVDPFLNHYGVYPYDLGAGEGQGNAGPEAALAFYHLMGSADGSRDLLEIADDANLDIEHFDRAVEDLVRVGLIQEAPVSLRRQRQDSSVIG